VPKKPIPAHPWGGLLHYMGDLLVIAADLDGGAGLLLSDGRHLAHLQGDRVDPVYYLRSQSHLLQHGAPTFIPSA